MDSKAMVTTALTEEMIQAGNTLVRELDKRGLDPDAVFWFYSPDTQEWKLIIAEVKLATQGPRETYKQIQSAISALGEELHGLALGSVALAKPDTPIVSLLRVAVGTGPGISGTRFTNNVINGTVIDDAYIYRLARRRSAKEKQPET